MNAIAKNTYHPTDSLTQYGDGIFETMLGVGNEIYHWQYHWARLHSSCERLEIAPPDHDSLYGDIQAALKKAKHNYSVVKLIVSRGEGLRGYRSHASQPCFVQFSAAPYAFQVDYEQGLNIRICQTRLAAQPLLAGMKHCNRLEYVMARREGEDGAFDEGLLLDYDNRLIEGLISNVFIMTGQRITTPPLDTAGVSGTMRAYLLDNLPKLGFDLAVSPLTLQDVKQSEAVFLSNATNGVMPVKSIQGIDKTYNTRLALAVRQLTEHPSL